MFKIYYTDPVTNWSHAHDADTLSEALRYTESFRRLKGVTEKDIAWMAKYHLFFMEIKARLG